MKQMASASAGLDASRLLAAAAADVYAAVFFLRGTFAPARRAFESPIAIACLRFLCSPFFRWCISVRTSCCAFGPYLRRLLPDRDERLLLALARELRRLDAEVRRLEPDVRRRELLLRLRDERALPDDERRRALERDRERLDVERLRGERRDDDLLLDLLRLRDDVLLLGIRLILPCVATHRFHAFIRE
jgi:hypothetical protein